MPPALGGARRFRHWASPSCVGRQPDLRGTVLGIGAVRAGCLGSAEAPQTREGYTVRGGQRGRLRRHVGGRPSPPRLARSTATSGSRARTRRERRDLRGLLSPTQASRTLETIRLRRETARHRRDCRLGGGRRRRRLRPGLLRLPVSSGRAVPDRWRASEHVAFMPFYLYQVAGIPTR